jgi:hypothetical protein
MRVGRADRAAVQLVRGSSWERMIVRMRAYSILRLAARTSALVAGLSACNGLLGEGEHRVIGVIDEAGTSIDALVVPDTVRVGVPFTITVSTFGSSCLRPDGVVARASGTVANVTPYDVTPPSATGCPADVRAFPRTVTLAFDTPGAATVQLHGRGYSTPMITVEEAVVVAP